MVSSISSSSSYLSASIAKLSQQLFNLIDRDSDGSVSKTDLQSLSGESSSVIDDFISAVDASDDQAITQQEFASALAKLFQEMKSSSMEDGAATVVPPPPPPDSGEMFSSLDTDSDGSLTLEELQAGGVPDAEKIFGEIDTDGDGKISQAESDAFDEKMKANGPQNMAFAPPPPPPQDSDEMFSSLDTDSDGSLTLEELQAGGVPDAEKIFGEIDTDGDGKISRAESNAFDEKMKANGAQVAAEDESSSVNLTSAQTELFNTLMELIAQSGSYTDSATQIKSVFA